MELEEGSDFEKNKIVNSLNNIQINDEMDEECEKIKFLVNEQLEILKSILGSKDFSAGFFLEKFSKMGQNVKSFKELLEKNKNLKKPLAVVLQENSKLKGQILESNDGEIFKKALVDLELKMEIFLRETEKNEAENKFIKESSNVSV